MPHRQVWLAYPWPDPIRVIIFFLKRSRHSLFAVTNEEQLEKGPIQGWLRPQVHLYFPPLMPVDQPFNVYRDQLTSQYHGTALWHPNPVEGLYDCGRVSIGDVGYLDDGVFIRMFNVTLPWDNPSNAKLGIPNDFSSLEQGLVHSSQISQTEYHSHVSKEDNTGNVQARIADE